MGRNAFEVMDTCLRVLSCMRFANSQTLEKTGWIVPYGWPGSTALVDFGHRFHSLAVGLGMVGRGRFPKYSRSPKITFGPRFLDATLSSTPG